MVEHTWIVYLYATITASGAMAESVKLHSYIF